jgi:hypothetical protein
MVVFQRLLKIQLENTFHMLLMKLVKVQSSQSWQFWEILYVVLYGAVVLFLSFLRLISPKKRKRKVNAAKRRLRKEQMSMESP